MTTLRGNDLQNISFLKLEILEMFVNTLTADYKYPARDCENFHFPIQIHFSEKQKTFSHFFFFFFFNLWILHQILSIFEKNMLVIANVFLKLQTVEDLVKKLSWKRCFRTSFDIQHVNWCQTLVKSTWGTFYHIFWSLWGEMICKISPLFIFEILGVFVNTLAANEKYPVQDCENLQFPIQMQLS